MFACAPLATGLLILLWVRRRALPGAGLDDRVRALLLAAAIWGAYLVAVSEALSLLGALRSGPLLAAWALPVPLLGWACRRREPATQSRRGNARAGRAGGTLTGTALWEVGALAAAAAIVAVTGLVAWLSAPNTWDSMTYHLPRVMHWAQNGSLAHYPTHEPRQLYLAPWAELVALHFQVLGGGDRAARLIQWLAMAGCLLAVSTIAGRLGAGPSGRILSVVVAATIPMGLLQAVSTQTDYAVGFHLLTAVCFLPEAVDRLARRASGTRLRWPPYLWGAALATGLAALTKGTAYVVLAPFLATFAWRLAAARRAAAWRPLALFAAVALAINLGHYGRNVRLFGSPLEPRGLGAYHRYSNETFGAGVTVSNAARLAALHLTMPSPPLVAEGYGAVRGLHRRLGLDPEDPRTTWPDMRFEPPPRLVHEDFSGNPLHSVLILACFAALCFRPVRRALPELAPYALQVAAGCLLFAALLKWTPWSSRLQLPLFVLAAPVPGILLARRSRRLAAVAAAALLAQAIPFLAANPLHPLTGEASVFRLPAAEQTLRARPRLGDFYARAAERLTAAQCRRIGLDMPPDAWEYPLWVVLRRSSGTGVRLESLAPGNVSRRLLDPRFEPCAVVCLSCDLPSRERHGERFGEPVLAAPPGDRPGRESHLLYLAPPEPGSSARLPDRLPGPIRHRPERRAAVRPASMPGRLGIPHHRPGET